MRLLVGLVAVLALAGCGSVASRSGAPAAAPSAPRAEAPPIQAVDEAPSAELQRSLELLFTPPEIGTQSSTASSGVDFTFTWTWGGSGSSTTTTVPTKAEMATIRAQMEAQRAALRPAPGSQARVVARLPLADGGDAVLVAWHNEDGQLCTDTQVRDRQGSGGGGPGGSCTAGSPWLHCAEICLTSNGSGTNLAEERWVLSGTVAADADAIDVTTAGGATAEYPLTGPLLDGGDRRAFLLELGATDWRKLVLLRAGQVVDQTAMPALSAASEDCMAKIGEMPAPPPPQPSGPIASTPAMEAWNASLQACMMASGALPAFPARTP